MKSSTYRLVVASLCLAAGLVLPFLTGQIPLIGNMLLPMHIPVFVCAFCCKKTYGALVGLVLPLLRSFLFTKPELFPDAIGMAAELCVYGFVAAWIFEVLHRRKVWAIYASMIPAMIAGRVAWGVTKSMLFLLVSKMFTWELFVAGALINAVPGLILQLIVVPVLVMLLMNEERFRSGYRRVRK